MLKSQKAAVIEELEGEIREATALIVTDYRGLSVSAISGVRNGLRPLEARDVPRLQEHPRPDPRSASDRRPRRPVAGPDRDRVLQGRPGGGCQEAVRRRPETRILRLKGALVEGQALDEAGGSAGSPPCRRGRRCRPRWSASSPRRCRAS